MSSVQEQREAMLREVTTMSTNLTNFITQNTKDHKELKDGLKEQNGRVRKNELRIAWAIGGGSAILTLITILSKAGVL